MKRAAVAVALLLVACSTRASRRAGGRGDPGKERQVRVALVAPAPRISGTADFAWLESDARTAITRGRRGEQWRVEREARGERVRAVRPDGVRTAWHRALVARVNAGGHVTVNGKRYRGDLIVLPLDDSVVVVNRLGMEDYLRGVVPVEMGNRPRGDAAALQAQTVASRSFAWRRTGDARRAYHVRASVADQAYGGFDAENEGAGNAVDATRGLVLHYQGRVADAPYSSTCGGSTAEPDEIWGTAGAAYLRRVSDRIAASQRYYCDIAPRFRWTRTLTDEQLNAALDRYLRAYTTVPAGRTGTARALTVNRRTESGRVAVLDVETDRGTFPLRANAVRYVLRVPGGEILPSTYFSVEPVHTRDGVISRVTLRGQGNGHGVGMCQWGAIGRARAGQSFRTILGTYYPGTTVGPVQ